MNSSPCQVNHVLVASFPKWAPVFFDNGLEKTSDDPAKFPWD